MIEGFRRAFSQLVTAGFSFLWPCPKGRPLDCKESLLVLSPLVGNQTTSNLFFSSVGTRTNLSFVVFPSKKNEEAKKVKTFFGKETEGLRVCFVLFLLL